MLKQMTRGSIASCAFVLGVVAGCFAMERHTERNQTAQYLAEVSGEILAETDPVSKMLFQDSYQAAQERYDRQTILMCGSAALAGCCLLFLLILLAITAANRP